MNDENGNLEFRKKTRNHSFSKSLENKVMYPLIGNSLAEHLGSIFLVQGATALVQVAIDAILYTEFSPTRPVQRTRSYVKL